jgi:hypothetical protein
MMASISDVIIAVIIVLILIISIMMIAPCGTIAPLAILATGAAVYKLYDMVCYNSPVVYGGARSTRKPKGSLVKERTSSNRTIRPRDFELRALDYGSIRSLHAGRDQIVTGLDADYSAWKISQLLLAIMCDPSAPAVGVRCRVILEGWVSKQFSKAIRHGKVPDLVAPYGALDFALRNPASLAQAMRLAHIDSGAVDRVQHKLDILLTEVTNDPLKYTLTHAVAANTAIAESIANTAVVKSTASAAVVETDLGWSAGDFRLARTPRLTEMAAMAGSTAMVRCCLRYGSMLAASHHWAAPTAVFDALWRLGVRNEAFASPLNSGLFGRPSSRYFSLFRDTDGPFGSQGSVFAQSAEELSKYEGGWELNPPFVFGLMLQAADLAVALAKKRDVVFIIRAHDPAINPVSPYAVLAEAAVASIILPAGTYAYEAATASGNVLKAASFPSHILYAGPRSPSSATALLEELRAAWPAAPSRLESAFNTIRDGARLAQMRALASARTINPDDFWRPIATALATIDQASDLASKSASDSLAESATWRSNIGGALVLKVLALDDARPSNRWLREQISIPQNEATSLSSVFRIAMLVGLWLGDPDPNLSADYSTSGLESVAAYVDSKTEVILSAQISTPLWSALIASSKFE